MSSSQSQLPGSADGGRRGGEVNQSHKLVGLDAVDRRLDGDFAACGVTVSLSQSLLPDSAGEGYRRGEGNAPHRPVGLDTVDRRLGRYFAV